MQTVGLTGVAAEFLSSNTQDFIEVGTLKAKKK